MLTRKLACPSCGVGLKLTQTLPTGKRIRCPKCSTPFAVPDEEESEEPRPQAVATRPRKAAPPPADEDDGTPSVRDRVEERPRPRKLRKRSKKAASNTPLILGLSLGGLVLLLGAGGLAYALWSAKKPTSSNAAVSPTNPGPNAPVAAVPAPGPGANPGAETQPTQPGGESSSSHLGRQVYDANGCAKCHRIGGGSVAAGGRGGRGRGPDLSRVGANPTHTVEWLSAFIRNPKTENPTSRMPAFEGKIRPQEMRDLAEYLASLK